MGVIHDIANAVVYNANGANSLRPGFRLVSAELHPNWGRPNPYPGFNGWFLAGDEFTAPVVAPGAVDPFSQYGRRSAAAEYHYGDGPGPVAASPAPSGAVLANDDDADVARAAAAPAAAGPATAAPADDPAAGPAASPVASPVAPVAPAAPAAPAALADPADPADSVAPIASANGITGTRAARKPLVPCPGCDSPVERDLRHRAKHLLRCMVPGCPDGNPAYEGKEAASLIGRHLLERHNGGNDFLPCGWRQCKGPLADKRPSDFLLHLRMHNYELTLE